MKPLILGLIVGLLCGCVDTPVSKVEQKSDSDFYKEHTEQYRDGMYPINEVPDKFGVVCYMVRADIRSVSCVKVVEKGK